MRRDVSRFQTDPSLSGRRRDVILRVYSYAVADALSAARMHRRGLARQHAETCRELIAAFGQPNPYGAFNHTTGKFEPRPASRSEVRHAS